MADSIAPNNSLLPKRPSHLRIVFADETPPNVFEDRYITVSETQIARLIRKGIKKELKKQSRISFWQNSTIAIVLFLLGVIASLLVYIISTLHR